MVSRKNQREKHFLLVTVAETGEVDQYLDLPDPEICNIFNLTVLLLKKVIKRLLAIFSVKNRLFR